MKMLICWPVMDGNTPRLILAEPFFWDQLQRRDEQIMDFKMFPANCSTAEPSKEHSYLFGVPMTCVNDD